MTIIDDKEISNIIKHEVNLTAVAFGYLQDFLIHKGLATKTEMDKVNNQALQHYKVIIKLLEEDKIK